MPLRLKILLDQVRAIQATLDHLPETPVYSLTKREAIELLIPQITALQAKGHHFDQIAETLTAQGLPISPVVLKNYVSESKQRRRKKKGAVRAHAPRPKSEETVPAATTPASRRGRLTAPPAAGPPREPGKPVPPIPPSSSASPPVATPPAPGPSPSATAPRSPRPPSPRSATFVPRPDSEDL